MADPVPPPPPPFSASPPRILIIGAGSRGNTYAHFTSTSSNGIVAAVAEPDPFRRRQLGRKHIWGDGEPAEGQSFDGWEAFVAYERRRRAAETAGAPAAAAPTPGIDAVFVCVLDDMHRAVVEALADLGGLHIMCEKPLATTLADCVRMYRAVRRSTTRDNTVFAIGHVLRYSPHNRLLRRLVREQRVIGDVLSIVHTEPVGWWHFAHSYVRGHWRREDTSAPSLLTKSCHDMDVLLWLMGGGEDEAGGDEDTLATGDDKDEARGPPDVSAPRQPPPPTSVSSSGGLQLFRRSRKPPAAGAATNCLACPAEPDCRFSAKRIYVGDQLQGLATGNRGWPVSVVVPDMEDYASPDRARNVLLQRLAEDYTPDTPDAEVAARNWFGRCVYEADNDVCDEQVVVITWEGAGDPGAPARADKDSTAAKPPPVRTATFHMVAHTSKICQRYTHLYGTHGEIYADQASITVEDFRDGSVRVHHPPANSAGHGGGDAGLTRQFILAVDRVKNHAWPASRAQHQIIACSLDDILRSHALVFCAEAARRHRTVEDWAAWWAKEVGV